MHAGNARLTGRIAQAIFAAVERIAEPVLVTGATGFIGRRVVQALVARGVRARALVLPGEPVGALEVEVVRGAIEDRAAVSQAVRGAATVIHLAAVVGDWGDESVYSRITVDGTRALLELSEPGAKVVLASSVVVYGDRIGRAVCDEEAPWGRALGPYSRSKQAQEKLARQIARARGVALAVVRPTNVFGAGSRPWVHDALAVLARGLPALVDGGGQDAGLAHVDNVAALLVRAAEHPGAAGRVYNACDGNGVTWRRYFTDLARIGGAPPPRSMPRSIANAIARGGELAWRVLRLSGRPPATREAINLVGSHHRVPTARARFELGWSPVVGYAQGLDEIAASLAAG